MSSNYDDVVIVAAYRTAIGSFLGSLSSFKAHELGSLILKHIINETNGTQPDDVIIGQALTAGQGQNPARQTSIGAGCSKEVTATTINMLCGSGLKSVVLGYQTIKCDDASVVVCGGQESMSQAPHCLSLRSGCKMGNANMIDTMLLDGLTDAFNNVHMGRTADYVASKYQVSREEQDKFAVLSQEKYQAAKANGSFKNEIVPIKLTLKSGEKLFDTDEHPRANTSVEVLSKMKPAFTPTTENGTITAGNASGLNDGAALVMLMKRQTAASKNLQPLVKIVSWSQAGNNPMEMGVAPILAIKQVLQKANWSMNEVDVFEINEAFASQSIAILNELGIDRTKVNVNGGSIAIGHPIGCSGARILVTLIHILLSDATKKKGLAALCIGGGMSIAMCIEKI